MAGEDTLVAGMAGRYATAIFELARDENELEATEASLVRLDTLLQESEDLRNFVRSPLLAARDQSRVISAIADKAGLGKLATNFLQLLVQNRRLSAITDIIAGFRKLAASKRDELAAEVISAIPLSDVLTQELSAMLKAKTGKTITLNSKVEPAILGGLIVKMGSRMVDSSIRTKLNNLKIAMKEVG